MQPDRLSKGSTKVQRIAALCVLLCAVPALAADPVPVRAAPDRFAINAFDVSGVSKLDAAAVETAVYPYVGPGRTATDVEAARKALEAAYKARGLESVLVEIPPQPNASFVAGVIELKVTEASVGRVRVVGSKYHALTIVTEQIPALKEGEVPDLRAVQAQLRERTFILGAISHDVRTPLTALIALAESLQTLPEGGDAELVAKIFGDKQVLEFIRPMLANMDEYRRIREAAMNAQGTVEEDYARRLKTAEANADRWRATIANLNISIGQTLLPLVTQLTNQLIPIIDKIGAWADAHPQLTSAIIATTAALIGFKAAATALSWIGLMV